MTDVAIAVTADEIEAEIIRSRLESEGIPVRIAPRSRIGLPAAWSPRGLGYGIGSFDVRVPQEYAQIAREIVAEAQPPRPTPTPLTRPYASRYPLVLRVLSTVVLLYMLVTMAIGLAQMLPELF